jgi:hypothetical protein
MKTLKNSWWNYPYGFGTLSPPLNCFLCFSKKLYIYLRKHSRELKRLDFRSKKTLKAEDIVESGKKWAGIPKSIPAERLVFLCTLDLICASDAHGWFKNCGYELFQMCGYSCNVSPIAYLYGVISDKAQA